MATPYFVADHANVTILRSLASSAFGTYTLNLPDGVELEDVYTLDAPGNELGYVADVAGDRRVGGLARRFVRADVSVTAADSADPDRVPESNVDRVLREVAERVSGDFFLESDISRAGLGPWREFVDFMVGDTARVDIWGRIVPLPITRIDPTVSEHDIEDVTVHLGGQIVSDEEARQAENLVLHKALVQDRRDLAGLEAVAAAAKSTADAARVESSEAKTTAATALSEVRDEGGVLKSYSQLAAEASAEAQAASAQAWEWSQTAATHSSDAALHSTTAKAYSESAAAASAASSGHSTTAQEWATSAAGDSKKAAEASAAATAASSASLNASKQAGTYSQQAQSASAAASSHSTTAATHSSEANLYSLASAASAGDAEAARKLAEEERRLAENARAAAEADRKLSEEARAAAERARDASEQGRADAETQRMYAEQARARAEAGRAQSHMAMMMAEWARDLAEQHRAAAEASRAAAETERARAETARAAAEADRAAAEKARSEAETFRAAAETARDQAEQRRAAAETERVKAETARIETERIANQQRDDAILLHDNQLKWIRWQKPVFDYRFSVESGLTGGHVGNTMHNGLVDITLNNTGGKGMTIVVRPGWAGKYSVEMTYTTGGSYGFSGRLTGAAQQAISYLEASDKVIRRAEVHVWPEWGTEPREYLLRPKGGAFAWTPGYDNQFEGNPIDAQADRARFTNIAVVASEDVQVLSGSSWVLRESGVTIPRGTYFRPAPGDAQNLLTLFTEVRGQLNWEPGAPVSGKQTVKVAQQTLPRDRWTTVASWTGLAWTSNVNAAIKTVVRFDRLNAISSTTYGTRLMVNGVEIGANMRNSLGGMNLTFNLDRTRALKASDRIELQALCSAGISGERVITSGDMSVTWDS